MVVWLGRMRGRRVGWRLRGSRRLVVGQLELTTGSVSGCPVCHHWCPVIAQLNPYNQLRPQEFSRIWCGDDISSAEALFGQLDRSRQNAACCLAAPSSRNSWPMCRSAPSNGASRDTAGSTRRHVSPAGSAALLIAFPHCGHAISPGATGGGSAGPTGGRSASDTSDATCSAPG